LLIGLALLIIAGLIADGTRITAAGIVLSIGAFVNYYVVVAAARGLGRYRRWALWAFGILQLFPLMVFCVLSNNDNEWFVVDESTLPPNEFFGRGIDLDVIFLLMGLAAMLGIVPILLFSVVLFRPRCRRLFGRP
jgi:hypothetical protein